MTRLSFEIKFRTRNELSNVSLPVEVRRANMALAATSLSSESVELAPGSYYVTAMMPAGQELSGHVELVEGEPNKAVLRPEAADESPYERHASQHYLVAQRTLHKAAGDVLESLGGAPVEAKLRRIQGDILNGDYEISEPSDWHFRYADDLAVCSLWGTNKIQFAQLLQPGVPALNMALPVYDYPRCKLNVVRRPDGRFTFDAHLEHVTADMLLRYSQKGLQEQASLTAKAFDAERLLQDKLQDPIAAAVGAYALLRFCMIEYLHDWTENLRNWFKWLPDGSAIRGEQYARRGEHREALRAFLELSERGLPLFADGLSYAVDRLRVYSGLKQLFADDAQRERAQDLLERLQATAACTDFREPFTTFTGLVPDRPDNAIVEEVITIDDGLDLAQVFTPGR